MGASTAPTATLEPYPVEALGLPDDALDMLARKVIGLPEICPHLGISRQAGKTKAEAYLVRTEPVRQRLGSGKPYDVLRAQRDLIPKRNAKGTWLEIPCWRIGRNYKSRAEWIVPMVWAWWRPS